MKKISAVGSIIIGIIQIGVAIHVVGIGTDSFQKAVLSMLILVYVLIDLMFSSLFIALKPEVFKESAQEAAEKSKFSTGVHWFVLIVLFLIGFFGLFQ